MNFNPYSPMMEFFYKILLLEEVFSKINIFGFIFEKKKKIWEGTGFFKTKPKCLGSNKNVSVALFCVVVVVQSKTYLWHWKMCFTLILKFCLNYPTETKQENY